MSKEDWAYLEASLWARPHSFEAFRNAGPLCLAETSQTFILLNSFTLVTTLNATKHFPPYSIVIVSIINKIIINISYLGNKVAEKRKPSNTSVVKAGGHRLSLQLALQVGQVVTWIKVEIFIYCAQFKNLSTVSGWKIAHQAFDCFKEILLLLLRFWRELKRT